jgi:hypothetical protein
MPNSSPNRPTIALIPCVEPQKRRVFPCKELLTAALGAGWKGNAGVNFSRMNERHDEEEQLSIASRD